MNYQLPSPLSIVALALTTGLSAADRGLLNADGILVVKGAEVTTAQITVVPQNATAYTLPVGTKRFMLRLPVNDTYLVSFEREGCPTKDIYFDTTVPSDRTTDDFEFPFMVTLEHQRPDRMFSYEGPVGFVRYLDPVVDFGYETQYLVKVNEELKERLREMQATGMDPKTIAIPTAALVVDVKEDGTRTASAPSVALGDEVAANVSEVPRLVHNVVQPGTEMPAFSVTATAPAPLPMSVIEEPVAVVEEKPAPEPVEEVPIALPPAPIEESVETVVDIPVVAPVIATSTVVRQEEILEQPRMIIHIVRFIRPDGRSEEFRKVTHAYGQTFYFQEARSISERAFEEYTAQR